MSHAIYPGSFDPLTRGHLDLIHRGARVFARLIVAVARNTGKAPIFTPVERVAMVRELTRGLPNVEVVQFDGMTVDFARRHGCTVILRGIRTMADFEYESQLAFTNRALSPEMETVLMLSSQEYAFISSRWIKEATIFGGDLKAFVPPPVEKALRKKLGKRRRTRRMA
ncbi:MAG: pantetheine-phosphate adenylyltransferase [Planctomycetes bacterium]|nr:pantetheine-phosphate adenylyltransferase [Planctomycetota bacterium]